MGLLNGTAGIVTGAGAGIGRSIAMVAAREGASVVTADIKVEACEETASMIRESGGKVITLQANVTDDDAVHELVEQAVSSFGQLNWAVNNAAFGGAGPLLADISRNNWDRTINGTLMSVWLCMKHEIPQMIKNGGGNIVNIGSMAGVTGNPMQAAYAAAKGGVIALSKSAAAEYALQGIRVNVVNPGMIRTPGVEVFLSVAPEMAERAIGAHALNRPGEPEEVAETAVFLCSDRSSFITGECIAVDGGTQVKATTFP
ncbi:MAG: glucose 1-dehydrogenase [Deltaproteobacteria bacterium]|nr:glucose 1-dehydrogenase [Deltaproteobacteria bacterium]